MSELDAFPDVFISDSAEISPCAKGPMVTVDFLGKSTCRSDTHFLKSSWHVFDLEEKN